MNLSRLFITRPIGTVLLSMGIAIAGLFAFTKLPVAPLPQIDLPTIVVQATVPGASPENVATSVASPLERRLGAIADVTEMTSMSTNGSLRIILQFGLDRDIDGAARDVQAAINAARADLPTSLRSNPTYRKFNPASAPILLVTMSSDTLSAGQLYDTAATVLQQSLSQVEGVGNVSISGSALPAVRAELDPQILFQYGISFEDVRAALASANANSPKGSFDSGPLRYQLYTNDQARVASQYSDLVVAYRNGSPIHLSDLGRVVNSVEDVRNLGMANSKRAVIMIIYPQPGANLIDTVDRIRKRMPQLTAALPADIDVSLSQDRTTTIRASLHDTELTLVVAVLLVIAVVFAFLRDVRAVLVPAVVVPISIIGTFAVMYLLGYTLDILSLMALTIATGFVVDDAIVVLENIARHAERGLSRREAALLGAKEVGPTVVSITLSLIAVFLPILLMSGIVGRLFREFAVTLSVSIAVSLVISLTLTPVMCSLLIDTKKKASDTEGDGAARPTFWHRVGLAMDRFGDRVSRGYGNTLGWSLRHPALVMLLLLMTIFLNVYLYIKIPKGFFPQQDTGRLMGGIQADQNISFQAMSGKFAQMMAIVRADPAVASVIGSTGGTQTNGGQLFVALKPRSERNVTADQVVARLRPQLDKLAGARLFLQSAQDIRTGGRQSNAQYQYTLLGDSSQELYSWTNKLSDALQNSPNLADVNSDLQQKGLETEIVIDRPTAARYGIRPAQIDNTLYDAFGQRQVSTIYNELNQYHVILTVDPKYWQSPEILNQIYISTSGNSNGTSSTNSTVDSSSATSSSSSSSTASSGSTTNTDASISAAAVKNQATNSITATGKSSTSTGAAVSTNKETMVPLSAIAHFGTGNTPLAVNHQGQFVATTISFNLPPGKNLDDALADIRQKMAEIGVPGSIQGSPSGTAATAQQSQSDMPLLILAAIAAVYIVLGILYESYVHPVTILSTLPSAGVGALLALRLFNVEFGIIALIGVILLIGIVKKNAIMMIDFAIEASRVPGSTPLQAIYQACMLRFRPIMMTTLAAVLGAVPLTLGIGEGSEMRQPLGISIVGGLLVSQLLTLYTTPVVYLLLEKWRERSAARRERRKIRRQEKRLRRMRPSA